jgi:hypothetical protein
MDQNNSLKSSLNYNKLFNTAFLLILFTGLFLRFFQYLMGRSLWEDETHLALNFMKYGYLRLTKPLDWIQGAPIFFLFAVKTFVKIFGYGELAFRALPFIASVLTFPLFYYIILELTKNRLTALIGFFIFAVNAPLIYFSSELKPYAVDVSVYLLMIYLAISSHSFVLKHRTWLLVLAGCLSILFSNVAFIVLFAVGCNMFLTWFREKKINKRDIIILMAWGLVFAVNYFLFIHNHPSTLDQRNNYAFAFCPTDVFSEEFASFFKKTIEETFFTMLLNISQAYYFSYVLLFIFLVAIGYLIVKRKYTVLLFTCLPIIFHLALSAMKLYPFWYRLILYLLPCFMFLMAVGTNFLAECFRKIHVVVSVPVVIIICWFFTEKSIEQFPLWPREIKPALDFVNEKLPQNAHVYVTDPINAYNYYYKREYVKNKVYKGLPWGMDVNEFYEMLGNERSNYIWFYGTVYQWGYGHVLEDLKKRNLIVTNFEFNGYGVCEVKPLNPAKGTLVKEIDHTYFDPGKNYNDNNMIVNWGGTVNANPFQLAAGKYVFSIVSKGTPLEGVYPHNNILINGNKIGEFYNTANYSTQYFNFEIPRDTVISLTIQMDNDDRKNNEDRNSFIWNMDITK